MTPTAFQRIQTNFFRGGRLTKCKGMVASFPPAIGAAVVFVSMSGVAGHAQALDWDAGGAAANGSVDGGTGDWDAGTQNWSSDAGVTNETYTGGGDAVFGGTAGTVTVQGLQEVSNITFNTDGYVLNGGNTANDQIRLVAGAGEIAVNIGTATLSVSIEDAGVADTDVVKTGAGTLVLDGFGLYRGDTVVQEGTLQLTNTSAISNTSGTVQVDAGATLQVSASNNINGFAGDGETVIDAGQTLTTGYNGRSSVYGGVISGAGNLRSFSDMTLSGDSTYTGVTTVAGDQVTLTGSIASTDIRILANASFPASLNIAGGGDAIDDAAVISNAGTLILTGNSETVGSVFGAGNINLNDNTLTTGDASNGEISGSISGTGGLTKVGSGTLTLSGANSHTGTTTLEAGGLTLSGGAAIANTGAVVVNGGTLTVNTSETIGSLAGASGGVAIASGQTLTTGGDNSTTSYGGVISGAGGLTKSGTGTMTLNGMNTYTGETIVNSGGTLVAGNSNAFGTGNNFRVSGTADLGGFTITKFSTISQGGTLQNGTLNMTGALQIQNATVDAVLSGTGYVASVGGGTSTLSAANTFTGNLVANYGVLDITGSTVTNTVNITDLGNNGAGIVVHGASLADTANVTISNSGVLTVAGDETIGSLASTSATSSVVLNANLTTGDAGDDVFAGVLSGTGDLINQGSGTFELSGANTATGTLTNNAGTVVVSGTWAGDIDNDAVFDLTGTSTVNGTFNNNATGSVTNSGGVAAILTGLTDFIADGAIGDAAGSIAVNTQNLTYRDNHAETGTVTFNVSDTITEERTAGPTWAGTGFTANFATAAAGVFALGGDFTTTGSFTHNSSADLTVTSGNTMTVDQFTNNGSAGVQSGGTLVASGVTNTGTMDVAAAGVIDASGGAITNSGTLNTNGSITMATLTNTGTVNAQGTITGAVVNQGSGDFNVTGNLSGITSFTNSGAATFDVNTGNSTIGSLTNTTTSGNGTTIAGFATLNVTGAIENGLADGSAASVITNNWTLNAGSTLTNYAGATLNSNAVTSALMATGITNYGTMNVQGLVGAGAGAPTTIVNSGSGATFNVVGNTYGGGAPSATSPSSTPVGSFSNENGAVLNVSGGEFELSTLTNTSAGTGTSITTAGVQVAASGVIDAASIANSGSGTLNNAGTMNAASGVTNGATATMVSTGTINGNLTNAGAATLSGNLNGTLTNNGAGAVTTNGDLSGITTLTQNGSNAVTVSAGDRLEADVITVNAGSAGLNIGAGATLAGLGNTLSNAALINVAANGVVEDAGAVSNLGAGVIIFADGGALNADTDNAGDEGISNAGVIHVNGGTTAITLGGAGIFANSNLLSLASGASVNVSGAMTNSGTINMQNGTATETVSITGDYAGGGDLGIDVNFDTDSSDMLSVTGNVTGATTTVFVNDIGSSAVTGNDIVIASVTGTGADDAFVLSGPLSFGAQVYDIQQSGSDYILGATGAFVAEVAGLEALSYSLIRQTGGATMQQRLGAVLDTGHDVARVWATTGGGTTRFAPASSGTGYTGRMDGYELRAGVNFDAMSVGAGKLIFGLHGVYSAANTALMSDSGEGAISTEGYSIGASATWIGATGHYADAQLQYTGFDNSIAADGAQSSVDGLGYAASIEVGKRMALAGSDWTITPNGQLHYASVDFDDFTSGGGLDTAMQSADSLRVGLGVVAERTTQRQGDAATTIYGLANIYHELDGELLIDVAGSDVVTQLPEWSGEVGVGLSRGFENGMGAAYAQVTLASSLDSSVNDSNLGLAIGAQMSF